MVGPSSADFNSMFKSISRLANGILIVDENRDLLDANGQQNQPDDSDP